jgi:hypothetical protein
VPLTDTAEAKRLAEDTAHQRYWKRWGPYLTNRQWGTVREDYSPGGTAWSYFPHDMARSRAYRWGEDGLGGISDTHQRLCFGLSLWNGTDPILKERLFGLTNDEGNHGEDVKEYYFYLDNTPTHSYMQFLYKYPQQAFPYESLVSENGRRRSEPFSFEYELLDTGVFNSNKYFDVFVTYAKSDPEDLLIRIEIINQGPDSATLEVLPTLWFRNTWSWDPQNQAKPTIAVERITGTMKVLRAESADGQEFGDTLGKRWLYCDDGELLFTENETNYERLGWGPNRSPFVKDSITDFVVSRGAKGRCNPALTGTKVAIRQSVTLPPGQRRVIRLRLSQDANVQDPFGNSFDSIVDQRKTEADAFYQALLPAGVSSDLQNIHRQAYAGMLWCKQCYYYIVKTWLDGDPVGPPPPSGRTRNSDWQHFFSQDVLSMPDDWEYPWFAAWDLSFHTVLFAYIDPAFAKHQLDLITREWYMHPNGEVPAYEWGFGDVNPPVQAWAAWRVYNIEKQVYGTADTDFLESVFQKLMLYLTWWVNVKDEDDNNLFQGGFLGLDNIGLFNRDNAPPMGGHLDQSDGTSWMGMYCLNLLQIALELTKHDTVYLDMAMKLFQHFLLIADAFNEIGNNAVDLWNEEDGFYYDILDQPGQNPQYTPLRVRSMVGLIPLFAVETLSDEFWTDERFKPFADRFEWFLQNRSDITATGNVSILHPAGGAAGPHLLSLVNPERLKKILLRVLDQNEFLGLNGIRSMSQVHRNKPFSLDNMTVSYEPAEASVPNVNSNWRGPVWMPVNYLLIESLETFGSFLGDQFKVEFPVGSGVQLTLPEIAKQLASRLIAIFSRANGRRPVYGGTTVFQNDPNWRDYILFFEYFHGDSGAGLGASHQTGWSGLVADLIQRYG